MNKKLFSVSGVLVLGLLFIVNCGGSSSTDETSTDTGTFTLGTDTLTTDTTESGGTKTTVVTDANGNELLTMELTVNGLSLIFPGYDEATENGVADNASTDITFADPLSEMPTDYSVNLFAAYVAGQLTAEDIDTTEGAVLSVNPSSLSKSYCGDRDSPGCDWFPDTNCTLSCCADHDACYALNECGASSWIPFVGSDACKDCNAVAAGCIELSCAGAIDTFTEDNCFDNRCGARYDCTDGSCDCTSPCEATSPAACVDGATDLQNCCGNGSCEVGETTDNCYGDCYMGDGTNTCCVASDDCPTEGSDTCVGSPCCCCGMGEVCDQSGTHLCTASSRGDDANAFGIKTPRW